MPSIAFKAKIHATITPIDAAFPKSSTYVVKAQRTKIGIVNKREIIVVRKLVVID